MNMNYKPFKSKINKSIEILEKYLGNRIEEIWLFGSVARGDAKATSDVDIMVSMREKIPTRGERFDLYELICEEDEKGISADLKFCVNGNVNTFSRIFNEQVIKDRLILRSYKK